MTYSSQSRNYIQIFVLYKCVKKAWCCTMINSSLSILYLVLPIRNFCSLFLLFVVENLDISLRQTEIKTAHHSDKFDLLGWEYTRAKSGRGLCYCWLIYTFIW